jgi:hypothetical protein
MMGRFHNSKSREESQDFNLLSNVTLLEIRVSDIQRDILLAVKYLK